MTASLTSLSVLAVSGQRLAARGQIQMTADTTMLGKSIGVLGTIWPSCRISSPPHASDSACMSSRKRAKGYDTFRWDR